MRELSIDSRQKIINLHKAEDSDGEISSHLDIPISTIQSVIKKFAQFGAAETLSGLGRKQNLSVRTARKLFYANEVNNDPRMVLDNIVKRLETEGTQSEGIQRCLNKNGLHGYRSHELHFTNHVLLLLD